MTRSLVWMLVAALAAGCGKKEESREGASTAPPSETAPQPDPAEQQRREEEARQRRAQRIDELRAKERELQTLVAERKQALDEMIARHEREEKELPDPASFRRRVQQLIRDANLATSTYHSMKRRWEELREIAESKVTGELKTLREQKAKAEERYQQALSDLRRVAMEASFGVVGDSPVKREFDAIRAAKKKWFQLTPDARRGTAGSAERQQINQGFRSWLNEDPVRAAVIGKVLAQPEAGAGKSIAGYDFTDLEFFILLELLEDLLDKQNVAVENKQLAEEEKKLNAIEEEIEGLREKIAQKMIEGGAELSEFEDLDSRLETQKRKSEELQRQLSEWRRYLAETHSARMKHIEEQDAARAELEAAQKELREVRAELRRVG